ncbi:Fe-S cluster assembly sulfur transfer protein SufU [Ezakiella coagulans]|uniref:Fe-S cluster assembly sulfur transfer protein SufU n=1 Tax=Ezakiella coagulans TaxID=46507 RepID=UPI002014CCF3|nr:SUF system NifU family Fe-S cluster assembly protein [Ezakiella coagulans]UQK60152.1 SUF system NifU family Fe-S cluster assembly protein [Ezakiella coagulans]
MELDSIYTELILHASSDKKNFRKIENPDIEELGHNPSCGDELTIYAKINDGKIVDASFTGEGCAISKASTSLMIDIIKGKTVDEAKEIISIFLNMIRGEELTKDELKKLKDARVFEGIKKLPARVKCATLSWHTMENLLEK